MPHYEQIYPCSAVLSIPAPVFQAPGDNLSKELVAGGYIIVVRFLKPRDDFLFIEFEVITERVEGRVLVSQLHIKKTCKHIGIRGQHNFLSFLPLRGGIGTTAAQINVKLFNLRCRILLIMV